MKNIVLSRPKPGADKLKIHFSKSVGHVASQRKRFNLFGMAITSVMTELCLTDYR